MALSMQESRNIQRYNTRDSRYVSVLSMLTAQSVQAVHLFISWLGMPVLPHAL